LPKKTGSPKRMIGPGEPFVDANVIVRLVTGDNPAKQVQAAALFQAVESGTLTIGAPDTVLFEVVYVLASKRLYNLSRLQVQQVLAPILRLPAFKLANKRVVFRALDLYASTNLPFGDAFIVAAMEESGTRTIYSFDAAHLDKVPGIERLEPGL